MIEVVYQLAAPEPPSPPPPVTLPLSPIGPSSYATMLRQLLPRGAAWLAEQGSVLQRTLQGIAEELARVDARAYDLLREQDPREAIETLEEWERAFGITEPADTVAARQAAVTQRLVFRGGQSRRFFLELAAALGYAGATIGEFQPMRVGFRAGDRCVGQAWGDAWELLLPSDPGPHAVSREELERIVRRAAPAHTVVVFTYI